MQQPWVGAGLDFGELSRAVPARQGNHKGLPLLFEKLRIPAQVEKPSSVKRLASCGTMTLLRGAFLRSPVAYHETKHSVKGSLSRV